jgi:SAM-dependent methyltransferase
MHQERQIRRFYEDNPHMVSSPFGGLHSFDTVLLEDLFQRLGLCAGGGLLDAGCGRALLRDWVLRQGGVYTGVDLSPAARGPRIVQGSALALPFADGAFDIVCCIDAFEHMPDMLQAAREFHRVLRPGGAFFLSAPNYGNVAGLVKRWMEATGRYAPKTWAPFGRWQPQECEQPLTPRVIRRTFTQAGFTHIRAVGLAREVELGLFPWIDHPRSPDAFRFRAQRLFRAAGPAVVRLWPGASLHLFWGMTKPTGV